MHFSPTADHDTARGGRRHVHRLSPMSRPRSVLEVAMQGSTARARRSLRVKPIEFSEEAWKSSRRRRPPRGSRRRYGRPCRYAIMPCRDVIRACEASTATPSRVAVSCVVGPTPRCLGLGIQEGPHVAHPAPVKRMRARGCIPWRRTYDLRPRGSELRDEPPSGRSRVRVRDAGTPSTGHAASAGRGREG